MPKSEAYSFIARPSNSPFTEAGEERPSWLYRNLGIDRATDGRFHAHIVRVKQGTNFPASWHAHDYEFSMFYVLKGWVKIEFEHGVELCDAGCCVYQPPRIPHAVWEFSEDLEVLEIFMPAKFETYDVEPPNKTVSVAAE